MGLRPRYTLRTLFVAITLFGAWLGWQSHLVKQRKDRLQWITDHGGKWSANGPNNIAPMTDLPWYRTLLGDQAVDVIWLPDECTREEAEKVEEEFPESQINPDNPFLYSIVPVVG